MDDPRDRRIGQLETTLMRRNEQLAEIQAALTETQASHAFRLAQLICKVVGKVLPLHSRRRRSLRTIARMVATRCGTLRYASRLNDREGTTVALDSVQYARWIRVKERSVPLAALANRPTISIVVPTYDTPAKYLEEMLRSVLAQSYVNWELCIADASTQPHVRAALDRFASAEPRIRLANLAENRGIAGNTNAALALATGDYIAFLDHDDTLAPFALAEVAATINRHPEADLIYSDEDKLDESGQRVDPTFKPDWSPDLLRTHNYVCHLLVIHRRLLKQLGGIREGFDGAQDYDLVLRAGERARRIVHIPRVLYHWRLHQQSTAQNTASKEYLVEAGRKALAEHMDRCGDAASVQVAAKPGEYRVVYHLPRRPLVSVLIPNRDSAQMLGRCVESLDASGYGNVEVLILENGSTQDDTFTFYRHLEQRGARIITWTRPFNYAAVNNFGAAHARGEVLLFLNNDIETISPDWLEEMVTHAVRPQIGAVGAKLLYADGTIQHAGVVLGMGGVAGHVHLRFPGESEGYLGRLRRVQNVAALTGACLMTRRDVFERVGGFDERFVLAYNDVDYTMQVRALGYRVLWTPEAELYHLESKTRGYEDDPVKQERFRREFDLFRRKWAKELEAGDPYFNRNFRLDRADCALRA